MQRPDDAQTKYRDMLQSLEQESQRSYDKTVLTLSGGALGISFAFVNDIVGESPIIWHACLLASWILWGLSVTSVLVSFFFSQLALRKAVEQLDNGKNPGNYYDNVTKYLNALGGLCFFGGVISMVIFAAKNMG